MIGVRRLLPLAVACAVMLAGGPARAAEPGVAVAEVPNSTEVEGHGGRIVWSRYDRRSERFSLMTRHRGRNSRVPVRGRATAFDVDLGLGPSGGTVAVYSRCRTEPGPVPRVATPRGCDLFMYDFRRRRERRLRAVSTRASSEFRPSVWGDRIAFVRAGDPARSLTEALGTVVVQRLDGRGSPRTLRGSFDDTAERDAAVLSVDLRAKRVAFTWRVSLHACRQGDPPLEEGLAYELQELWLGNADGSQTLVEKAGCGGAALEVFNPFLSADRLLYLARVPGMRLRSYGLATGGYAQRRVHSRLRSYLELGDDAWAGVGSTRIRRLRPLELAPAQAYPNRSTVGPAPGTTAGP